MRWLIPALALLVSGCAFPAILATPAGAGMLGAVAGASAAAFRLDTVVACWLVAKEGIQEAQSVSAVCVQPAGAGKP